MKQLFFSVFYFISLPCLFAAETAPRHILFIGNSYTSVNSLPTLFQEITVSAGLPKPVVGSVTPGGMTLQEHAQNKATLELIDVGAPDHAQWDVVILQEQSTTPAVSEVFPQARDMFLQGTTQLFQRIHQKSPGADVILYETWARHADVWKKDARAAVELGSDATDMQQRIRKWYEEAARVAPGTGHISLRIARVGDAWEKNYKSIGPLQLHVGDGSHPTFAGSYLAGLVLFSTVYGTSPTNVKYIGSLLETDATVLKKLATM